MDVRSCMRAWHSPPHYAHMLHFKTRHDLMEPLSTILLIVGISGNTIGLADIFLTSEQKQALDRAIIRLWIILDDCKTSLKRFRRLENRRYRISVVSIPAAAMLLLIMESLSRYPTLTDAIVFLLIYLIIATCGYLALSAAIYAQRHIRLSVVLKIFAYIFTFHLVAFASLSIFGLITSSFTAPIRLDYLAEVPNTSVDVDHSFTPSFWIFALVFCYIAMAVVCLLSSSVFMIMAVIVTTIERVVRAIADYPKGILLGTSGMLTSIGAILKLVFE
jgi:hypothetical protein